MCTKGKKITKSQKMSATKYMYLLIPFPHKLLSPLFREHQKPTVVTLPIPQPKDRNYENVIDILITGVYFSKYSEMPIATHDFAHTLRHFKIIVSRNS